MSERAIAHSAKAPVPVLSQAPARVLQRKCACGQHTMGGECEGCKKKHSTLQRKPAGGRTASVPPIVSDVLRSPGRPLGPVERAFFEPKFGHDFSRVRVHTGSRAAASAAAVDAAAYTVGTNIVFGEGKFGSDHGLLGHELAHVVQQSSSVPAYADLTVSRDVTAEQQADRAAAQVSAGNLVGPLGAAPGHSVQREEAPKPEPMELNWFEKGLIEAAAAPALALGDTVHGMVKATLRGFLIEVKTQAPARGQELWEHVKDAFRHPTQIGAFLLRYWWGLIKGIFSPITGLWDMAKLVGKLVLLGAQIGATAWARREELATDAASLGDNLGALSKRARDAMSAFLQNPMQTVKALAPWFSSLQNDAVSAAETGGHKAGAALMEQMGKPLPELGETAGEIIGTLLINIVLLVFTEGIGNAITQVASKLGELGTFLGKFGKAAEMLGKIVAEVGELLGTVGGWISKAEAALAKVAETVLKPIAPLMEELGKLMSGLRSFLRKLLGVSEEAAASATEQLAGTTAKAVEGHVPSPPVSKPLPKPPVSTASVADQGAEVAGAKVLAKPSPPSVVKPKPVTAVTQESGELVGAKATPKPSAPPAVSPKPQLASRAKVFEGISEETEQLLARRPGLARALGQHPEAADLFKLCKSHCFPDFMTDEEIVERLIRLERLQRAATEVGVPFERGPTKELLHRQKTVDEVDKALSSLEDALRVRIRKIHLPGETEEPLSALARPQTKMPPRPKGKTVAGTTTQFEGRPEKMPEGFEDLPEQTGAGERGTAGGRGEKPKTAAGKFAHEHAELLQKNPEILEDLRHRTGRSKIFDTELPEGLQPEYAVIHKDYPPGMRPRIDRLWRKGDTIFEIKPNTFAAEKGEAQVQQYAEWMDRFEPLPKGEKWKWKVVQYDQTLLQKYLEEIGWLPKAMAAKP
jgi:hypothetical protein